jgi:hypothetical protein
VKTAYRRRPRREPKPQQAGLVDVRQSRTDHAGRHRRAAAGRRGRGEGRHRGQAGQPVKDSDLQELPRIAPVAPVRDRIQREVGGDAEQEGGHWPPHHRTDERAGQNVIRHQHQWFSP